MKKFLVAFAVFAGVGCGVPVRASAHPFFGFSVPGVSLFVGGPPAPAYYEPPVVYRSPTYFFPPVPRVYAPGCHHGRGWGERARWRQQRGWDD